METKFTEHFESLLLTQGAKALHGKKIVVGICDIGKDTVRVKIAVADTEGKLLSYITSAPLREDDTVTVLELDQMFNVAFVREAPHG